MSEQIVLSVTLVTYLTLLVSIGLWANRRTSDNRDFYLGGRQLGPWVSGLSSTASASSAWSLIGVSSAAYVWGISAFLLAFAAAGGYLFNWLWLAPRLRRLSRREDALTLTDVLARADGRHRPPIAWLCSAIIVFCFAFYVAAQFQGAGHTFAANFSMDQRTAILLGAAIILVYTLLGGFWAVSLTDSLQGLLMAVAALLLPIAALIAVGGPSGLRQGLAAYPGMLDWSRDYPGLIGLGFIIGTLGIGLGNPGQPHVVNRYMALKSDQDFRRGMLISVGWGLLVYGGMALLGMCARVLLDAPQQEQLLFEMTRQLFPPVIAAIITAAILSAIMSTADSQLLVSASSMSHDLSRKSQSLIRSRLTVAVMCVAAAALALLAPASIFDRVLFAWHGLASAFAPLLIVRLTGRRVAAPWAIAAIGSGFGLTVLFSLLPAPPGDYPERILPFVAAGLLASIGARAARG